MSTTLTQSTTASFPDRPAPGAAPGGGNTGIGLLVTMATGTDGQYAEHDLGSGQAILHTRVMFNAASVTGGSVVILFGRDAAGVEIWRMTYDASTKVLTVLLVTTDTLTATLTALPWQCIEIKIDTAGTAELWINGVPADTSSGSYGSLSTRYVWLGGIIKNNTTTGAIYLDDWVMSSSYIGPVIVTPTSPYADDPARWLVVYNAGVADSVTWVENYRAARGVPYANLCGLSLSITENINASQYDVLRLAVQNYLVIHQLEAQVLGILLGFGVPGFADILGTGQLEPVPDLMHLNSATATSVFTPLSHTLPITRPTMANLLGLRLTARLDAPTLQDATNLLDRSSDILSNGLGDGLTSTLWLDPYTVPGSVTTPLIQSMVTWSSSLSAQRLRVPLTLSATSDPQAEVNFTSISQDGFFWGWSQDTPGAGFFSQLTGKRIFCSQLNATAATCTSVRDANSTQWVGMSLLSGYASAAGSSRAYSLTGFPDIARFFDALRAGWTLAEAWFLSRPLLREGLTLIGDPLMTVPMPQAGYTLFGPGGSAEVLDLDQPLAYLRTDQLSHAIALTNQPTAGSSQVYGIGPTDTLGRSGEISFFSIANVNGSAAYLPWEPIWPFEIDWPLLIDDDQVVLTIQWEQTLATGQNSQVQSVSLFVQIDTQMPIKVQTKSPAPMEYQMIFQYPLAGNQLRFQFEIISSDNAIIYSPWSARYVPSSGTLPPLAVTEQVL